MALPAMNVSREADALPESPDVSVSEKWPWTSSTGMPMA
jgi:hypothetical protein